MDPTSGLLKIGMDLGSRSEKSDLLTGLKAKTNFGRPDWNQILDGIARKHALSRVNVFCCGPYPLGRLLRIASRKVGFHFRMEHFYGADGTVTAPLNHLSPDETFIITLASPAASSIWIQPCVEMWSVPPPQ